MTEAVTSPDFVTDSRLLVNTLSRLLDKALMPRLPITPTPRVKSAHSAKDMKSLADSLAL